jgi:hypothetical protein
MQITQLNNITILMQTPSNPDASHIRRSVELVNKLLNESLGIAAPTIYMNDNPTFYTVGQVYEADH